MTKLVTATITPLIMSEAISKNQGDHDGKRNQSVDD
jgi:hypothetical protein